jgi:hypothetical protein
MASRIAHEYAILCRDNGSGKYEAAEVNTLLLEPYHETEPMMVVL